MKSRINILYIYHVSTFGGGSFCLLNIVKKLDRENFNPIVLLKKTGPLSSELEKLGVTVYFEKTISTVPYNRGIFKKGAFTQILKMIFSLSKIKYWIQKTNADIIHINTMMMYPYAISAQNLGKKVIIHVREHWPKDENKYQFKIAHKVISKYTDKIIAINKSSAEIINLPHKTEIIYDWIDFENRDNFMDFEKIIGADHKLIKTFLFLGGMQKIKGALEVVEVFSEYIHKDNVRLLFVGCEDKNFDHKGYQAKIKSILRLIDRPVYSDKIKKIAQKDERIVFLPATNHVKSLIEQSFCLVSYFTIPHANLPIAEATWLGVPTISANTPESIEYCADAKSTLLFEINNKEEFKNTLLFAIRNEKFINTNASIKMTVIRDKFDPVNNSALLNKVYIDLLNNTN
jgi:glycosyltransferase involved in cell wall biosynthesis